jgi:hypothetical protein
MKTYMTPHYYDHNVLMVTALRQAARQDQVIDPQTGTVSIDSFDDEADNAQDIVRVSFANMSAKDTLVDTRTNETLFVDTSSVTQTWEFHRVGNTWLLDGIRPATANDYGVNGEVKNFAAQNGMFYSDYLIAQVTVPKSYGRILVTHNDGLSSKISKLFHNSGLQQVSMEWPDFNKKYNVYASTAEGPTSFELLNPTFMERLEALPFTLNLEVTDNVVYLYAEARTNAAYYAEMLTILKLAYNEMKL